MFEQYLTVTQFADQFKISRQAVHKMIKEGRVQSEKVGSQHVIPKSETEKISVKSTK